MNVERLNHLITIMEKVSADKLTFNMGHWAESVGDSSGELCGTSCCALGWACFDPQFAAEGLRMEVDLHYVHNARRAVATPTIALLSEALRHNHSYRTACPVWDTPDDEVYGLEAGQAFFDLTDAQAGYLFLGSRYEHPMNDTDDHSAITPEQVIEHIRNLIADPDVAGKDDEDDYDYDDYDGYDRFLDDDDLADLADLDCRTE